MAATTTPGMQLDTGEIDTHYRFLTWLTALGIRDVVMAGCAKYANF